MQVEKFIDEKFSDEYEIWTPDGWKDFDGVAKTIEFQEYIIKFEENDKEFICADEHILILIDGDEVYAKDLNCGDKILSVDGYVTVKEVEITDKYDNMYDLMNVDGHIYFTDGIASHNTTITAGVALHHALFKSYYKVAILSKDDDAAKNLLDMIKLAFENLPEWLQQGVSRYDAHEIHLENKSKIFSRATSKTSLRGKSSNLVLIDEFAFIDASIIDDFYASAFETISSGETTKLIIISTPNGYNLYHKLWSDAIHGRNSYAPVKVLWHEVPGRDDAWKQEKIKNTSLQQFMQEHECSFESSTKGLINPEILQNMMSKFEDPIAEEEDIKIYDRPKNHHKYLITIDTAKGVELDYSSFSVIDITGNKYKQVAIYRCNKITPLVFPEIIDRIGRNYNYATLLIENNEYGHQIGHILWNEFEYEHILWTEVTNKKQRICYGNDGKSMIGVKMSSSVKNIGCSNLKTLIEHDKLEIVDYATLSELSTFIKVKNSFEAEIGRNDDIVMTLVLFAWMTTQDYFKDLKKNVGEDIRNQHEDDIINKLKRINFMTNFEKKAGLIDDEDLIDLRNGWVKDERWDNNFNGFLW